MNESWRGSYSLPAVKRLRISSPFVYTAGSTCKGSVVFCGLSCTTLLESTQNFQSCNGVRSDASSYFPETCMDTRLWRSIPDDLLEKILAHLPVVIFFRLRTVCKKWRFLAFSKSFLDMRAQVPIDSTFFLKVARCQCRALASYDPKWKKWYRFPITFLPSQLSVPVAADKGLLCFTAPQCLEGYGILLVCNPVTRCWRVLPPMTLRDYPFIFKMVVDRKAKTYKIIVVGNHNSSSNRRVTEMYDSTTCSWRLCGSTPEEEHMSSDYVVVSKGFLFCLSRGPQSGLLAFSLQQGAWIKLKTGRLPGIAKFRHLLECKGHILIIGKAMRCRVLGLYVWYLDSSVMRWREVGKMPQIFYQEFFKSSSECFYCAAQGDFILLFKFLCDHGLSYNITENSWHWISGSPQIFNPLLLPFAPGLDPVF